MTHERDLASPAFPDDDGLTDPLLADALGDDIAVLETIGEARVFVPIIPLLGEVPADGDNPPRKTGAGGAPIADQMAAVLMTGADGRTALLAFSSVQTMAAWDPQARPVPVIGRDAARATLAEEATALLLDLGSPSFTVVETADVEHLAAGHVMVRTPAGTAWLVD